MSSDEIGDSKLVEIELRDRIATMVESLGGIWSRAAIASEIRAGRDAGIYTLVEQLRSERDYLRSQVEQYRAMLGNAPTTERTLPNGP